MEWKKLQEIVDDMLAEDMNAALREALPDVRYGRRVNSEKLVLAFQNRLRERLRGQKFKIGD